MQMSALPSATAQRVANLKSDRTSPVSPTNPTVTSLNRTRSSIATSHPPSSPASKASDASLRSTRQNLPTIAGSPSVGTALGTSGTAQPPPSASSRNADLSISLPNKDTPTKIPRMSSRTSATSSPQSALKSPPSLLNNRRASLIGSTHSFTHYTGNSVTEPSPSPQASYIDEFGVLDANETPTQKAQYGAPIPRNAARASPQSLAKRNSIRSSPQSMSRVPRQLPIPPSSNATSTSATAARKSSVRDAVSFGGLRKSIASTSTSAPNDTSSFASRLSALSPSKSIKLLSPKVSLSAARTAAPSSTSPAIQNAIPSTPSSGRHSHSTTPSPVPSSVDEEELLGDEEMMAYIRRQQAKKLASGAKKEELDELLRFPEPLPPLPPSSPSCKISSFTYLLCVCSCELFPLAILKTSQNTFLSDYERKEILDYPAIYCIGARSEKKQAHRDNPTNNYGYDDERGDYLVVNHDHLAYRYEIIDTLGKGSFGQVLHCRDHCTGESVAIKIIRNKKRFHHQALVEIKILENLRKWVTQCFGNS
jgi:dual specificity tyrosine-phosphorylation-regulated kinase 2/3/4